MCQNIDQAQNDGFTEHILVKDALQGHIVTGLVNIGVMQTVTVYFLCLICRGSVKAHKDGPLNTLKNLSQSSTNGV